MKRRKRVRHKRSFDDESRAVVPNRRRLEIYLPVGEFGELIY